jgi:hypothetical protein
MGKMKIAMEYLKKHGCSVIPVKKNKQPYVPWTEFQERKATSDEIREWWQKWPSANVGIVTGKISGIVVIDVDETLGFDAIQEFIPDNLLIPTCKTPGGGQHLYFQAPEKPLGNNSRIIPGCDFRGYGGFVVAPPSTKGKGCPYSWLDGLSLDDVKPPPLPSKYINYINAFNRGIGEKNDFTKLRSDFERLQLTSTDFKKIPEGQRDETLFHIANSILNRTMQEQEVQELLQLIARHCCDPPFPFKEIPAKIKSVLNRIERRERNIAQEVREWVLTSNDFWLTSDCYKRLQLTSRAEQKAAVLEILRMANEGLIEKYGDKRGCYRTVDRECEKIDYVNAPEQTVNISLPFEIEKKVEIMPGNIIVIAGEMNAGKTAFLLNVIRDNMKKFEIHYFSSEMGGGELKKRLKKFDYPLSLSGWRFNANEKTDNFGDVIVPGEGNINVIDYLEIHTNFYEVSKHLAEIHKKLKGAVARLYLAMGKGKLKIVKAKNWATPNNPNGLEVKFKIVDGCKLIKTGNWHLMKSEEDPA